MTTDHPQVTALMPVQVDAGLAPLLRELWRLGADTDWSCQGDPGDEGYISFRHWAAAPTALDVARLLGIDAVEYTFTGSDYNPPSHTYLAERKAGSGGSVLRFPTSHLVELTGRARDAAERAR